MNQHMLSLLPQDPATVAGIDEAGRGCLAGPVVAAAVILPGDCEIPGLDDSKKLTPARREDLARDVKNLAVSWAVGVSWPAEIDRINILQATFLAMTRAVGRLKPAPGLLLIDGNQTIPDLRVPQRAIVGGDGKVAAISAASVLAKTWRDRLMVKLSRAYPGYGLEHHKGYGTAEHLQALERLGPCPQHRMTFRKVRPEDDPGKPSPKGGQACLPGL